MIYVIYKFMFIIELYDKPMCYIYQFLQIKNANVTGWRRYHTYINYNFSWSMTTTKSIRQCLSLVRPSVYLSVQFVLEFVQDKFLSPL